MRISLFGFAVIQVALSPQQQRAGLRTTTHRPTSRLLKRAPPTQTPKQILQTKPQTFQTRPSPFETWPVFLIFVIPVSFWRIHSDLTCERWSEAPCRWSTNRSIFTKIDFCSISKVLILNECSRLVQERVKMAKRDQKVLLNRYSRRKTSATIILYIPDICHERHEYIRVNIFWPV